MSQRPSADRTAKLLLWHQKARARFHADPRREAPLLDAETVFKLALDRRVEFSDPALKRVSAATLRAAALAHVREFNFRADATLYQVLGVAPDATEQQIREAFRFLMQLVHPDRQGTRGEWPDAFAARANHAYAILRNAEARAQFDREEAARAARLRLAQGAAAVGAAPHAASWPQPGRVARRPPPRAVLPEWLTAGVGGFARAHPAVVAFGLLIGIAGLVIGSAAWERGAGRLAREARDPAPGLVPPVLEATMVPVVAAPEPAPHAPLNAAAPPPPQAPQAGTHLTVRAAEGARANDIVERGAPTAGPRTAQRDDPPVTVVPKPEPAAPMANAVPPVAAPAIVAPAVPDAPPVRAVAAPPPPPPAAAAQAPKADEIEAQFVAFVDAYNRGRVDAIVALFDEDAQAGPRQGRAAIRRDYDDLFRRSDGRRMNVSRMSWTLSGEVAQVRAEGTVRSAGRDGRDAEERLALDMDLARRDGRVVIIRLAQRVGAP